MIPVQEYLLNAYRPDREYIDGEIQERNLGDLDHSGTQGALIVALWGLRSQGLYTWPEQRVQVSATRYRVPDVTVTIGHPQQQILTSPPYIVIEVLSPDDTLVRMMERVLDYEAFGVPNIWIIDPSSQCAYVASNGALQPMTVLRSQGEPAVSLDVTQLFE